MSKHEHNFVPLNDHTIYCAGCGEMNFIPPDEHHVCQPCAWPHHWWSTPTPWLAPWTVTSANAVETAQTTYTTIGGQ